MYCYLLTQPLCPFRHPLFHSLSNLDGAVAKGSEKPVPSVNPSIHERAYLVKIMFQSTLGA